ncbi:sulfotransferase [Nocardioides nanhaiensis]|uniref:Sulfotransferase n=1 Tax=Nocardioides nanhaiensis TaxID=1476871 RepID=A0ABP8VV55_9ACTN
MPAPTPLFVVGVARSGTTALTEVLSDHPQVVIGMERFKKLWGERIGELTPQLLTRERFLDFDDDLTRIRPDRSQRWADFYAKQADRFDQARYVGEKMTATPMEALWQTMPDARFVGIVRRIEEVAASWDARAARPDDVGWSERLDNERAVQAWNRNNTRLRRARRQHPERVALVEYGELFGDPDGGALRRLLAWLDLEVTPEVEESFGQAHRTYVEKVAGKDRTLAPEVERLLAERVAPRLWHHLSKLTV